MEDKYAYQVVSVGRTIGLTSKFPAEFTANVGLKEMFDKLQVQSDLAVKSMIKLDTSTKAHTESGKAIK